MSLSQLSKNLYLFCYFKFVGNLRTDICSPLAQHLSSSVTKVGPIPGSQRGPWEGEVLQEGAGIGRVWWHLLGVRVEGTAAEKVRGRTT